MSPHLRCCLFNDLGMRGWGEVEEEKAEIDAGECLFSLFIALAVFQVYKCSQFSQTPSRKVVLAATVRLKTGIF